MSFADRVLGIVMIACEADSQPLVCQQAVIASARNRVRSGRWAKTLAGVILQRLQYSEFDDDKADNANLERVLALPDYHSIIVTAAAAYDAVIADPEFDPSLGATHFYADGIAPPVWSRPPARLTVKLGSVNFYADVP